MFVAYKVNLSLKLSLKYSLNPLTGVADEYSRLIMLEVE